MRASLVPQGIRSGAIGKPLVIAAIGLGALLAGCGQKGPLYLPEAATAASPAASAASAPAATPARP